VTLARPSPIRLLLYIALIPAFRDPVRDETRSGGVHFNDVLQHTAVDQLPFAGVGESGYGALTLKYTFDEFSYLRSSVDIPLTLEPHFSARYPPYTLAATEAFAIKSGVVVEASAAPASVETSA